MEAHFFAVQKFNGFETVAKVIWQKSSRLFEFLSIELSS